MMLWYKAWLESRTRFFIGLAAVSAVPILYAGLHHVLIPQWIVALRQPQTPKPEWLSLAINDYRFYVWHFLFDYHLQWLWLLFGVVLSFGGLGREESRGTAAFSLGLPVTRARWLLTRAVVTLVECVFLAAAAGIVVLLAALSIGQAYPFAQDIAHAMLLVAGGVFFICLALLISAVVKGDFTPVAATIGIVGVPYLVLQEYVRRARADSWARKFDMAHVMAGPWYLIWSNVPWASLALVWTLAIGILATAVWFGNRLDY